MMTLLRSSLVVALMPTVLISKSSSLAPPPHIRRPAVTLVRTTRGSSFLLRLAANADDDENEDSTLASVYSEQEPYNYFQMQQIPAATVTNMHTSTTMAGSADGLDHVVDCAENGECNVEEMTAMIDELERLNTECTSETSMSRECHLDAVAARNVLKVALASKVMVEDALQHQQGIARTTAADVDSEEDPYASLLEMDDASIPDMHNIPTASVHDDDNFNNKLDWIVQCAEDGDECDVTEMSDMIEELERLNMECEGTISRECSLDAVAARNILKVALASQAAMPVKGKQPKP